jgi:hypothetical protein
MIGAVIPACLRRCMTGAYFAVVMLVVAGCGGDNSGVIAWRAERPPVPPAPPLATACRARDLRAALPDEWNGATGSLVGGIGVTNVSGHRCSLLGVPRIRIPGARVRVHSIPAYGDDPLNRPPLSSLRALAPGKSAGLMVIWSDWCGRPPPVWLVTLPGSRSTLRLRSSDAPRCNPPDSPLGTDLAIAHWVPAPAPTPQLRLPLRAELIGRTYPRGKGREVRYYVHRGDVLRFEVALINTSRKGFRFGRCPVYREDDPSSLATFTYVLNCRPAGSIPPGGRAVFEMVVPVHLMTGGGVAWSLPQARGDTFVSAPVIVR